MTGDRGTALYAQSGGMTAVINATAAGVIDAARRHGRRITRLLAARNGILGVLREELYDLTRLDPAQAKALRHTPGGAFGSCRFKLKDAATDAAHYERFFAVCAAWNVRWFFYNGGNDSADTCLKLARAAEARGYPLACVGLPKTIDNDLALTDFCPGFGSVAKYAAVSILEAGFDVEAMAESSTKVFVLEVMGRHAGWIAAASGLAARRDGEPPHLILFPERPFDAEGFLARVRETVERRGYCTVVASEGIKTPDGQFLAESGERDAFGHRQLGGVALRLCTLIRDRLGYKYHYAIADYLQRSARHLASKVDAEVAYQTGVVGVRYALDGRNAVMPAVKRLARDPYRYELWPASLADVANAERTMPMDFISADGYGITRAARDYLAPLIQGEAHPPYREGLPEYLRLRLRLLKAKLPPYAVG